MTMDPSAFSHVSIFSEGKRQADSLEGLETSEVKKAKLDSEVSADVQAAGDDPLEENDDDDDMAIQDPEDTTAVVEVAPTDTGDTPQAEPTQLKGRIKTKGSDVHFKENPYTFLPPEDPVIQACMQVTFMVSSRVMLIYWCFSSQLNLLPEFPAGNMLVRNPTGDTVRSLYLTNDIVKQIVENNDYSRMRLMTCGTKVIAKQEGAAAKRDEVNSQFRVLSEGLPAMLPYIRTDSILTADVANLKILMETYYPVISGFSGPFRSAIEDNGDTLGTSLLCWD